MILPIYIYGQQVLRKEATDITPDYPNLKELIANMHETMLHAEGVGLAAPQVGLDIRLLVINLDVVSEDYPEYKGFKKAYINAHIVEESEDTCNMEEGCLSIPGLHENVTRPKSIRLQYVDEDFQPHDEWIDGFLARAIQHEVDHLEGVLFIDHISGLRKKMVRGKLNAMVEGKIRCQYKTKTLK